MNEPNRSQSRNEQNARNEQKIKRERKASGAGFLKFSKETGSNFKKNWKKRVKKSVKKQRSSVKRQGV